MVNQDRVKDKLSKICDLYLKKHKQQKEFLSDNRYNRIYKNMEIIILNTLRPKLFILKNREHGNSVILIGDFFNDRIYELCLESFNLNEYIEDNKEVTLKRHKNFVEYYVDNLCDTESARVSMYLYKVINNLFIGNV